MEIHRDSHHLFSMPEIRERLIEVHGEPKSPQQKEFITKETKRVHTAMPCYALARTRHMEIHTRVMLRKQIAKLIKKLGGKLL